LASPFTPPNWRSGGSTSIPTARTTPNGKNLVITAVDGEAIHAAAGRRRRAPRSPGAFAADLKQSTPSVALTTLALDAVSLRAGLRAALL